ncbi:hypothetical protein ACJX0J_010830, partial [Zea mays]
YHSITTSGSSVQLNFNTQKPYFEIAYSLLSFDFGDPNLLESLHPLKKIKTPFPNASKLQDYNDKTTR